MGRERPIRPEPSRQAGNYKRGERRARRGRHAGPRRLRSLHSSPGALEATGADGREWPNHEASFSSTCSAEGGKMRQESAVQPRGDGLSQPGQQRWKEEHTWLLSTALANGWDEGQSRAGQRGTSVWYSDFWLEKQGEGHSCKEAQKRVGGGASHPGEGTSRQLLAREPGARRGVQVVAQHSGVRGKHMKRQGVSAEKQTIK